jgi:hypothetical protein
MHARFRPNWKGDRVKFRNYTFLDFFAQTGFDQVKEGTEWIRTELKRQDCICGTIVKTPQTRRLFCVSHIESILVDDLNPMLYHA